ncbi:MAG: flagellar hook-length control protein FliK [Granulosicoccus sp.]|nr:flagellar hook-length control protein FliK [Granulosicoccus sp.]
MTEAKISSQLTLFKLQSSTTVSPGKDSNFTAVSGTSDNSFSHKLSSAERSYQTSASTAERSADQSASYDKTASYKPNAGEASSQKNTRLHPSDATAKAQSRGAETTSREGNTEDSHSINADNSSTSTDHQARALTAKEELGGAASGESGITEESVTLAAAANSLGIESESEWQNGRPETTDKVNVAVGTLAQPQNDQKPVDPAALQTALNVVSGVSGDAKQQDGDVLPGSLTAAKPAGLVLNDASKVVSSQLNGSTVSEGPTAEKREAVPELMRAHAPAIESGVKNAPAGVTAPQRLPSATAADANGLAAAQSTLVLPSQQRLANHYGQIMVAPGDVAVDHKAKSDVPVNRLTAAAGQVLSDVSMMPASASAVASRADSLAGLQLSGASVAEAGVRSPNALELNAEIEQQALDTQQVKQVKQSEANKMTARLDELLNQRGDPTVRNSTGNTANTFDPSSMSTNQSSANMFAGGSSGIVTAPLTSKLSSDGLNVSPAPLNVALFSDDASKSLAGNIRWMSTEGVKNAVINVTPSGMGPISVQIGIENDQMNVSILANQGVTREALESMLPRLREQLVSQGHESVRVDVSDGRSGQSRSGSEGQTSGESRTPDGSTESNNGNTGDAERSQEVDAKPGTAGYPGFISVESLTTGRYDLYV